MEQLLDMEKSDILVIWRKKIGKILLRSSY